MNPTFKRHIGQWGIDYFQKDLIPQRKKLGKKMLKQKEKIPSLTLRTGEMNEYVTQQVWLLGQFNFPKYMGAIVCYYPDKFETMEEIVDESLALMDEMCDTKSEHQAMPRSEKRRERYRGKVTKVVEETIDLNNRYISFLESLLE